MQAVPKPTLDIVGPVRSFGPAAYLKNLNPVSVTLLRLP